MHNHTYELIELPQGFKTLGCRWLMKTKLKLDGSIDKYKTGLVVQGKIQKEGLDFFDTYSPVMRITSARILIAIATLETWKSIKWMLKLCF